MTYEIKIITGRYCIAQGTKVHGNNYATRLQAKSAIERMERGLIQFKPRIMSTKPLRYQTPLTAMDWSL